MKFHLKKEDFVLVRKGKDKGKKGRILAIFPEKATALVEGINFVKRHTKPKRVDRQGGILQKEMPIAISNLAYFCLKCQEGAKLGRRYLEDGTKVRFCKKCGEIVK
ncbi:MAG: 50S ribosomal protein L24 [bacterium (Candidatus Ratteibacteria) CG_4_10_14_3_um_filter_41_18]|uniref:Large ribosomal subunit protein uL24 n=3 Tax=Candidatus Ratteibacteria TaxID=2979319 RepID=A0A2M7YF20_9BACT|nr:MAG: 50S ribosomal protein L24 [Candidatus Omnitrophica bacterium CG1_02_41_171]PIW74517.1 MAG: 50S ribosomal protein L24 [bacterium (Candidatus Ratteibacteria) CG_4_8_14_3_um_filter_41_36]PIX77250.1 MAG: 50S ribosomal protein L24 [bacterium (Candidatus Ratteibacteria) CG_4_10_14_3_um_filter_41_18]PJA61565.1 MAG: 50S ribosomal protein L24 [bacterium (Candidatus Ratteibacteria) CG_4_9_14_3_um_filter_41_21]HCG76340.1 50S ribosomal protein L24 [bacterium]